MNSKQALLFLVTILLGTVSCSGPESHASSNEVDRLKFELEKVRSEQNALRAEISNIRDILSRLPSKAAPIVAANFKPDGSEKNDPFKGSADAEILLMAFSDYQCKPCRDFVEQTLPKLMVDFIEPGKVKYVLRDYPLPSNSHALRAAALAHCAGEQGRYWQMHDALIKNSEAVDKGNWSSLYRAAPDLDSDKLERCSASSRYEDEINKDIQAAKELGAKGAPGFFIGKRQSGGSFRGVFVRGAQPFAVFASQIEHLQQNGNSNL